MANINNVVNVSLVEGGELAARDNPNVVTIMTSQQTGPLSSDNRYALYSDAQSVAADFGTASKMADFANAFFATQPNPTNVGGLLVAGYWRGTDEEVAATAAVLEGAQISEATAVGQLQEISDGTFDIDIDGATENITALDFQSITTMDEAVAVIDAALTGGVATFEDSRVVITSSTTGATSEITFTTDPGTGTYVGEILALASGTGATTIQGAAAETLTAETKLEAVNELAGLVKFRGLMFIDAPTDEEAKDLAEWGQANNVLQYDVFDQADQLNIDPANIVWDIKLSGLTNYRMLYSKAGNRKMAASYMARTHTVNFNGENTALTMHLKELSIAAEAYTQTEITAAKNVGLDIYTTIKRTPCILTSGANDFVDNRYNFIAYADALQTDMYNLLKLTGTKIPQTRRGVNQLLDQAEKTTRNFRRAGVFAPGTWTSPDYFGDRETFERNIEENGFYWIAGKLADQPQSDREARKSPVLQGAVKLAGAVHSVDIIVNINK
jgi:hypothetical protein